MTSVIFANSLLSKLSRSVRGVLSEPPPPLPPRRPAPAPKPLDKESDVNPRVRRAKSKKDTNPFLQGGTGSLRIPLDPGVSTGGGNPGGGINV